MSLARFHETGSNLLVAGAMGVLALNGAWLVLRQVRAEAAAAPR